MQGEKGTCQTCVGHGGDTRAHEDGEAAVWYAQFAEGIAMIQCTQCPWSKIVLRLSTDLMSCMLLHCTPLSTPNYIGSSLIPYMACATPFPSRNLAR